MRTRLKHKLANRPSWSRIVEKTYDCQEVKTDDFDGYVTRLCLLRVKKPLYFYMHQNKLKVADDGYRWYMLFPKHDHYSLTVMVNDLDEVVECYFDIVTKNELNEDGIPGFDDLFLDVVFTRNDSIILDEDDLSYALRQGIIDADTADMAYFAAKRIMSEVEGHFDELCQWVRHLTAELDKAKPV